MLVRKMTLGQIAHIAWTTDWNDHIVKPMAPNNSEQVC